MTTCGWVRFGPPPITLVASVTTAVLRKGLVLMIRLKMLTGLILAVCATTACQAIVVTPNISAQELATMLTRFSSGISVSSSALEYRELYNSVSTGTFTNGSGTYGIGDGIVLSTGDVANYGDSLNSSGNFSTSYGVAASPDRKELLDSITGPYEHFDISQLDFTFDLLPGYDTVQFDLVFGSEEFPEYAHTMFNDGFGIYLNGENVAFVSDLPINISHPAVQFVAGTELDGVLAPDGNPVVTFTSYIGANAGTNTFSIIIADTSDAALDTTVFLSTLRAYNAASVPEPGSLAALACGLLTAGSVALRRARRGNAECGMRNVK